MSKRHQISRLPRVTYASASAAAAASQPVELDIVKGHLASRRLDRRLTLLAACAAALVLTLTLVHGYEATRPLPDQTFAFRV